MDANKSVISNQNSADSKNSTAGERQGRQYPIDFQDIISKITDGCTLPTIDIILGKSRAELLIWVQNYGMPRNADGTFNLNYILIWAQTAAMYGAGRALPEISKVNPHPAKNAIMCECGRYIALRKMEAGEEVYI